VNGPRTGSTGNLASQRRTGAASVHDTRPDHAGARDAEYCIRVAAD